MNNNTTEKRTGFVQKIFRPFITGFLAIFPLVITIIVIVWFVEILSYYMGPGSWFGQLLQSLGLRFVTQGVFAYLLGLAATLVLIYLFGILVQVGLRNSWERISDSIMGRIPVIKTIYDAARKIIKLLDKKEQSELKGMSPVMCYFGGEGGTAVLALQTSKRKIHINGHDYYSIMIPSSPVPIGGAILYVPVDWVEKVDFGFDGLFNVYMSMGVTGPDMLDESREGKNQRK
jgi:uncharacterized membrane protein